jgi:hypothetical protein
LEVSKFVEKKNWQFYSVAISEEPLYVKTRRNMNIGSLTNSDDVDPEPSKEYVELYSNNDPEYANTKIKSDVPVPQFPDKSKMKENMYTSSVAYNLMVEYRTMLNNIIYITEKKWMERGSRTRIRISGYYYAHYGRRAKW